MQKCKHRTTNQDMNIQNSKFLDNTDMNSTDYRQRQFHIYTPWCKVYLSWVVIPHITAFCDAFLPASRKSGLCLKFPCFIYCWPCLFLWFMVSNQLDPQFFSMYLFQYSTCFEQSCAHHQENQLYQYIIWYMSLCVGDRFVCRVTRR